MKTKVSFTFPFIGVAATAMVLVALVMLSFMKAPLTHAQNDIIPDKTSDVALADTAVPSDVENVKATPDDGQVNLSWNVATDNIGVKGYKLYYGPNSVTENGQKYTMGPVDVGNKITYTVTNLTNGTTYYFALTAYDDAGNESDKYSTEVSAKPLHTAADNEAPKVVSSEAVDKSTVKVVFSEAIALPNSHPESAFTIKNDTTQVALEVTKAQMDSKDTNNKTVLLTTAPQKAGDHYILTAGIQIKDLAGNPIVSGTSDTTVFTGTDVEPAVVTEESQQTQAQADTTGPKLVNVKPIDSTHIDITFSEPVKLSADATQNFIITEEENIEKSLNVTKVELSADETMATVTTAPQEGKNYNLIVVDVADKNSNLISVDSNATVFFGIAEQTTTQTQAATEQTQEATDKTAPEDATNFVASMLKKMVLHLNWTSSLNTAGDLANYILYKSTDGTNYGEGLVLNDKATHFDMADLAPGMKYFFKLTAKDKSGNESAGVVTDFTLPETGPELGFLLLGSLGAGKFLKRKKKISKTK